MAKNKKDWKLAEITGVTVKEVTVEITKPKPAKNEHVLVIDSVSDSDALLAHINKVEETNYTVSDILREYVNENILMNARVALRNTADPDSFVAKQIEKIKKTFPNLPEEQVIAMAAMFKESLGETATA